MISDLLKILAAIQDAKTAEEEAALRNKLRAAVEQDIRSHFDDPNYPKRRRSFESIQKALGIFDEDPQALKEILFDMGARPKPGSAAYWHLPKKSAPGQVPPRTSWSNIYGAFGALAAIGAILWFFGISGNSLFGGYDDRQACLDDANGNMEKISKCYRDFP